MLRNDSTVIGEVHCLNCARTLGEAVRNPETGRLRLQAALYREELDVEVVNRHTLRCRHCRGRAFIETLLPRDIAPAPASTSALVGAA